MNILFGRVVTSVRKAISSSLWRQTVYYVTNAVEGWYAPRVAETVQKL